MIVRTGRDRDLSVRSWLLLSAEDAARARREWDETGVALLRCGALLSAVRIERRAVAALAGTQDEREIAAFLGACLDGGPVFLDQFQERYYVLVPPSAGRRPEWAQRRYRCVAECLKPGTYVGVPRTDVVGGDGWRCWWTVPMEGPGVLCAPSAVSRLAGLAGQRHAALEGGPVSGGPGAAAPGAWEIRRDYVAGLGVQTEQAAGELCVRLAGHVRGLVPAVRGRMPDMRPSDRAQAEHCLTRAVEALAGGPPGGGAVGYAHDLAVTARALLALSGTPA